MPHRRVISDAEANAIVNAVGWSSAYYLEAFSRHLRGDPTADESKVQLHIENARRSLLGSADRDCFGVWPEHIRKHYKTRRTSALALLTTLSEYETGTSRSVLLAASVILLYLKLNCAAY